MCADMMSVNGEVTDLSEIISLSPAVLNTVRYEGVRHGSHSQSLRLSDTDWRNRLGQMQYKFNLRVSYRLRRTSTHPF